MLDFVSFEPIDALNRPFRLKRNLSFQEFEKKKRNLSNIEYEMFMGNAKEKFDLKICGGNIESLSKLLKNLEDLTDFDFYKLLATRVPDFKSASTKHFQNSISGFSDTHIIRDYAETREKWTAFIIYSFLFEYNFRGLRKLQNMPGFSS